VALDLNNVRVEVALKKLFDQVGTRYELDKDATSTNTRVTLRLRHVTFLTALQAVLEQADLGWATTGAGANGLTVFRIGRQTATIQTLPLLVAPGTMNRPIQKRLAYLPPAALPWSQSGAPRILYNLDQNQQS